MAYAKFKRFSESGKTALILVKPNQFVLQAQPAYVPAEACANMEEDNVFDIPDGFKLVPMVDEDGVVRTAKDGGVLHSLQY